MRVVGNDTAQTATPAAANSPAVIEALLLEPPVDYDEEQRSIWAEIVLQTKGRLSECDRWALNVLVNAIALHRIAVKKVREYGSVIKSPSGYPMQSPYVADMNKQATLIARFSSELGLTPAARQRGKISKTPPVSKRSPFADLKQL